MKHLMLFCFALLIVVPLRAQPMPVTTDSHTARAHFEMGRLEASNIQFDQALAHFDAALAADPDFAVAHAYRALLSGGDERAAHLKQAMDHMASASAGERMIVESFGARAAGDDAREMGLLAEAAEAYPNDPFLALIKGQRHYNLGDHAAAKSEMNRAIAVDPGFAPAYNMLGYVALDQEDYAAAERAFKTYVSLEPDEANPYDSYGDYFLAREQYDEAARQFELALERNPDFDASRDKLAQAGIEKANEAFERAFSAQDADALAALYTENGALFPPDGEPVGGRENIRDFWAGAFSSGPTTVELRTWYVRSMGDLAYEVGGSKLNDQNEGKYSVLWAKNADGDWQLHRDMWNASPPQDEADN